MKFLSKYAIMPWEFGLIIAVLGILLMVLGYRQRRKPFDDLNKIPYTKSSTKSLVGFAAIIYGSIQLISLIGEN